MSRLCMLLFVCALALAIVPGSPKANASLKAEDDFQLVQVANGVYAAIAKPGGLASGNAGFVIGDDGVLIFDTFFTPAALEELIGEIQKLTNKPIKYAVNSHYHLDHTGGNQVLVARGVPIIAHDNVMLWQTTKNKRFLPAPEELQKRKAAAEKQLAESPADQAAKQLSEIPENQTGKQITMPPEDKAKREQLERQIRRLDAMMTITLTNPTKTFSSGTMELKLGKRKVILATLPGHTGGDVFAFVPDANVVFMGDLGWSRTLPNLVDATVDAWIPTLDKIVKDHPAAKYVPGHGNVATAAEMKDFRDYLDDLSVRVKQGIANGLTIDQAKQQLTLPEKYKSFAFQNFATPNVEDMYKELKGTKQ
ncbi:MAG TPA: MBL fold metallo-hydrolase [Pyrinomonadaceae bacterium]|nr:MBL fold metallo-hydrolase [Pyrinomonadaceae bacterium]